MLYESAERIIQFVIANFVAIIGVTTGSITLYKNRRWIVNFIRCRVGLLASSGLVIIVFAVFFTTVTNGMKMRVMEDILWGVRKGYAANLDVAHLINDVAMYVGSIGIFNFLYGIQLKRLSRTALTSYISLAIGLYFILVYLSRDILNAIALATTGQNKRFLDFFIDLTAVISNIVGIQYVGGLACAAGLLLFSYWAIIEEPRRIKPMTSLHKKAVQYASVFLTGALLNLVAFWVNGRDWYVAGLAAMVMVFFLGSFYLITLIYYRRMVIVVKKLRSNFFTFALEYVYFKAGLVLLINAFVVNWIIWASYFNFDLLDVYPPAIKSMLFLASGVLHFLLLGIVGWYIFRLCRTITTRVYCILHRVGVVKLASV